MKNMVLIADCLIIVLFDNILLLVSQAEEKINSVTT